MKKILFISPLDLTGSQFKFDGVYKKILLQIKTLSNHGYDVDFNFIENNEMKCSLDGEIMELFSTKDISIRKSLNKFAIFIKESNYLAMYDCIYLRYTHFSTQNNNLFKCFKHLKKSNIIIGEMPTLMKKWEPGTSTIGKLKFVLKKILEKCINSNIDYMVTFDESKKIFGVQTIPIENFVDVESLPLKLLRSTELNEIHILGLANMTPSHGFDRVIWGLKDYYEKNNIIKVYFHVVGGGTISDTWRSLARELKLEQYVIFHGKMSGSELNDIFDKCSLAVGAIAIFRKNCAKASELKIREYISRGIPFIYSAYEPMLDGYKFCLKIPNDESPVSIKTMINFYKSISFNPEFQERMRKFALAHCSCDFQFKPVFNLIDKI